MKCVMEIDFLWYNKTAEAILYLHLQILLCLTVSRYQNSVAGNKW